MTSCVYQSVAPYHNVHPHTARVGSLFYARGLTTRKQVQGTYRDDPTSVHSELGYGYNVDGDTIPVHGSNHASPESWGAPASQPPNHGVYAVTVSVSRAVSKGHPLILPFHAAECPI
jgi:hypothetical protein